MPFAAVVALIAVLDLGIVLALAYVTAVPFRFFDRRVQDASVPTLPVAEPAEERLAA